MTDANGVNETIAEFGESITATVRREKRTAMTSPLFDLPGRSSLGFAVTYDAAPGLIERLEPLLAAEELGARMRQPLLRPYFLQLFILGEAYLMGREQLLLDGGGSLGDGDAEAADAERTSRVVSYFARVCRAYRTDGQLFPGRVIDTQPVLDSAYATSLAEAGPAPTPEEAARIERALGAIELYVLTLHGEQRDGIFDHGPYPYPGADGRALVFHELNDLRNDYLPWSIEDVRLPVDAVGVARVTTAATCFDVFGTMSYEPSSAPIEPLAVFCRDRDELRSMELDELEQIAAQATRATALLFRTYSLWEASYRTAYGAPLFANHLVPLVRLAGEPAIETWLAESVAETTERMLADFLGAPKSIWAHMAGATDKLFTPVKALR
jgi:hypothetical protein